MFQNSKIVTMNVHTPKISDFGTLSISEFWTGDTDPVEASFPRMRW
jgi:hypothetical protein